MYNGIYKERCFGYNGWPWTFSTTSDEDKNVSLFSNVSSLLLLFWYWWWGMLLFLVLLLLLLMSMPSDVSPSLETSDTWGFFYTSLRPFRLLLLWYLRMMSWIFGLCSKMLWHVSFASFTWIWETFYFVVAKYQKCLLSLQPGDKCLFWWLWKIKVWAVLAILIIPDLE